MRRNIILRAALIAVTIITLVAPATAQNPPPHTPPPPSGLIVESTGSTELQTGKTSEVTGVFPTPPVPDYVTTESLPHGIPPVPGQTEQQRIKDVWAAMKTYIRAHASGVGTPVLKQVQVKGAVAYGVGEDAKGTLIAAVFERKGNSWQPSSFSAKWCNLLPLLGKISSDSIIFQNMSLVSPDGQLVACVTAKSLGMEDTRIWVGDQSGVHWSVLAAGDEEGWVTSPSWSPDSNWVAYLKVSETSSNEASVATDVRVELWAVRSDGSERVQIIDSIHPSLGFGGESKAISWLSGNKLLVRDSALLIIREFSFNPENGKWEEGVPRSGRAATFSLTPAAQPSNVPFFSQCDERWGSDQLGFCSGATICSIGCAVTSAAMVFKYFGVDTDPRRLNRWLKDHNGYRSGCDIKWATAANISSDVDYVAMIYGEDWHRLNSELEAGYPVIVDVGGHFVVVTHHDGNTYYINDPLATGPGRTLGYYGNHFTRLIIYHGPTNTSTCPAPVLTNPPPDVHLYGAHQTFSWNPQDCGNGNRYRFRVLGPNAEVVIADIVHEGLQISVDIPSEWFDQDLYWSVRADVDGATWAEDFPPGYGRHFVVHQSQGSEDTVTIYSEAGYGGDKYGWHDPCTSPECGNLPDWLNTRASSIRIAPGWSVRVYEGDDQTGGQRCYNESDDNFGDDTFDNGHPVNDHVRSVAIYHQEQCPPPPSPPQPPAQPYFPADGSTHSAGTSFTLNWQPSANATEYDVHLEGGPGVNRNYNGISAHLLNVGVLPSGNYRWKVRARNQYGTSAYSDEWTFTVQEGVPNAPSNLSASAVSPSQINLSWSDNSSNETGFRLYREGLLIATLGAGTTTYQDTGLECGRGYNYYVVAYNDAGESGHSNTASATTQACPPTAPPAPDPVSPAQNTTFDCGDTITLEWEDLGEGVEYYVETWGANSRTSGWIMENSWYLGEQDGTRTWWHVKARYVGETDESGWGSTTWFNVSSCPQYPDLRPYAPAGYQYPVVPSMVQGTREESVLYVDQPTYFDWHFINDGNAVASGTFYVELWVDDYRVLRYPQPDFSPGQVGGWDDWSHTVITPGWHTVRLVTDSDDTVDESDESNNEWTRDFYWHVPCSDLNEPNDEAGEATSLSYGETATGVDICPLGDWDYYKFYGHAGETIIADVDAQVLGSNLDSVLVLYDSDGTTELIPNDDDGTSLDSRIIYTLPHDGYYYLRVREYSDGWEAGGDYFYNLSLAGAESAPYFNDFEVDTSGWDADGMWHLVDDGSPYPNSYSGSRSWWYGQDGTGDYDNGGSNSGSLTSPPIYIPDTGYYLRFNYWYETETQGLDYDRRCVQVSVDNGLYSELHCLSDDGMGRWHSSPAIDLSDFADHIVRIRFNFDTVDELYNNFRGWYIDDFEISNTPPPSCSDGNEPNDSYATATTIAYGETKSGYICPGGDIDYFAFTGNAGDTIVADINADVFGSWLDSVLVLLDSDGVTELASNDDAQPGSLDSLLGYTLPANGTYYLKIRVYEHPSYGDSNYYYDLSLVTDNSDPTGAFLAPTTGTYITSTGHISITAEASDVGSGVRNVTFLWHSGDWSDPDWEVLGEDWDGTDGWAIDWDVGSLSDQRDAALYAWAFDWGGNWVGMECWDITLDREPPAAEMEIYPPYGGASFVDFWLAWYGEDTTSGVASYDIQYKDGPDGTWTDLITSTSDTFARLVGEEGHTYYFRVRARDWAGNVGEYPATAQVSYTIQTCPVDVDDWEVDNTFAEASPIGTDGVAQTHNFNSPGDQDWVKFDAVEGQHYIIQTENVGGYADTVLYLYGTDGSTLLDFNDDFEGLGWASRLEWTAPADGTYYVMVKHWDEYAYGCETVYTLSVGSGYEIFLPLVLRNHQ